MRFLQEPALSLPKGWAAMLPAQPLSVLHGPLCMPSSYPHLWWLLQFESRPPLGFRNGPALLYVQYLAHDNHQNSNFLFRLR